MPLSPTLSNAERMLAEDLTPCHACGYLPNINARLWLNACAPLKSHVVSTQFRVVTLTQTLTHLWRDEQVYAAVEAEDLTIPQMIDWLDRCHAGTVERRPYVVGAEIQFDQWA